MITEDINLEDSGIITEDKKLIFPGHLQENQNQKQLNPNVIVKFMEIYEKWLIMKDLKLLDVISLEELNPNLALVVDLGDGEETVEVNWNYCFYLASITELRSTWDKAFTSSYLVMKDGKTTVGDINGRTKIEEGQ